MVARKRIEVHKATINVEFVIDDSCLISVPSVEVVPGILLSGTNIASCQYNQQRQDYWRWHAVA